MALPDIDHVCLVRFVTLPLHRKKIAIDIWRGGGAVMLADGGQSACRLCGGMHSSLICLLRWRAEQLSRHRPLLFDVGRAERIRLVLDVWNVIWAPISTLLVTATLLAVIVSLYFMCVGGLELVLGRGILNEKEVGVALIIGAIIALFSCIVFFLIIYLPLITRRIIGLLLVVGCIGLSFGVTAPLLSYARDLPAWWSETLPGMPGVLMWLLGALDPWRVAASPGLAVMACAIIGTIILWGKASFSPLSWQMLVRLSNLGVVVLGAWSIVAIWAAFVVPAIESGAIILFLAAMALLFYGLYRENNLYDVEPVYGIAAIGFAVATLWSLATRMAAMIDAPPFSFMAILDPAHAADAPWVALLAAIIAFALLTIGIKLRTIGLAAPFHQMAHFLIVIGGGWLIAAIISIGPRHVGAIVEAGLGTGKQVIVAVPHAIDPGFVALIDLFNARGRQLLSHIHEIYVAVTGVIWPLVAIFAGFFNLATGWLGLRVVAYFMTDTAAVAAALKPAPRHLIARTKYALGLAPVSYLSQVQSRWAMLVTLIVRMLYSASLACVGYAVVMLYVSNMTMIIVSTQKDMPSLGEIYGGTNYIQLGLVAIPLALASLGLRKLIYRFDTKRYEDIRLRDPRRPLLFLRPFKDDQVTFHFNMAWLIPDSPQNLDQLLLHLGGAYGPVVAIGRPDEQLPPFGAARTYVRDGNWRDIVESLIRESELIIVVVGDTEGVGWEIDHILETKQAGKTLFFLHPDLRNEERLTFLSRLGINAEGVVLKEILAVIRVDGRSLMFSSKSNGCNAHLVATTAALQIILGYPHHVYPYPKRFMRSMYMNYAKSI